MVEEGKIPFPVGSPVNVTAIGYSYYAATVVECDDEYVTVKFLHSKTTRIHKYSIKDMKPFKPQVNGNKLMPLKYNLKKLTRLTIVTNVY